jgi:hypothetical protein
MTVSTESVSIGILIAMVVLAICFGVLVWLRRLKKAKEAKKNSASAPPIAAGGRYRQIYLPDDSSSSPQPTAAIGGQQRVRIQSANSPRSVQSAPSFQSGSTTSTARSVTNDVIYDIVIQSWYAHLVNHSSTVYLKEMLENTSYTKADLVEEMKMLVSAIGDSARLVKWRYLTDPEKVAIRTVTTEMKSKIIKNFQRRTNIVV